MVKINKKISSKNKVIKTKKIKKVKPVKKQHELQIPEDDSEDLFDPLESEAENEENSESEQSDGELDIKTHKESLQKLKQTDPEFYKFLQENDKKLLQFNLSEDEASDEEGDDEQIHKPPEKLEIASDEEEEDDEGELPDGNISKITLKVLKNWQTKITTDKTNTTIRQVIEAFLAALIRVSPNDTDTYSKFRVEDPAAFNGVIQICILELGPAIKRFLGIGPKDKRPPHKCKKFPKIKGSLKKYFLNLIKLLGGVSSSNIQTVLLKHLHYMSFLLVSFHNISKPILVRLVKLWGSADDSVRVLAFFCILRITSHDKLTLLPLALKRMYMTYVRNSKFVSVRNLPSINFMRRSLVEIFSIDTNFAYSQVFLYIRQLAIHLRNAVVLKKRENIQTVCNWQYVNSLKLWGTFLAANCTKPQLKQLIYPLVQVCLGVIKMVPSAQYYPLRFHLVGILSEVSKDTGVFIPILPFLLEVLTDYDFNKKHQKISMKPMNFTCVLRLSKSQLVENGFKDAVIDGVYEGLLSYLASQSFKISFPDMTLFCVLRLKQFMKTCRQAKYTRKFKQLLEKIEQNTKLIENERKKVTFDLTDMKIIEGWESRIRTQGTPLTSFYDNWNKLHTIRKNKEMTENEELADYNLPELKKRNPQDKKPKDDGPVELFPSDSEDEEIVKLDETRKRGKRGGKNVNKKIRDESGPITDDGQEDIVQDLDDW